MSEQLQMLFPSGLFPRLAEDVAENRPLVEIGPINSAHDPPNRKIKFALPKQDGCEPTEICFEDGRIGEWRLFYDPSDQTPEEASQNADKVRKLEDEAKGIVSRFGPEMLLQDLRNRFPRDQFPDLPDRTDCKDPSEFFTLPMVRVAVMRTASEDLLRDIRNEGLLPDGWSEIRRRVFYEVDVSTMFSARYECSDRTTFDRRFWMTYRMVTALRLPDEDEVLGAGSIPRVAVSALGRFIESPTFVPTLNAEEWTIDFEVPEYREDCLCRYRVRTTESRMRFVVPGDDSYEANLFAYIMSQVYIRRVVDDNFRARPGFSMANQFFEIEPGWNECVPGQSVSVPIPKWGDHPEFEDPAETFASGFAEVIEAICGRRPDDCGERTWELGLLIDFDYEVELECDQVDRGIGSYCVILSENADAELHYPEDCEFFVHEDYLAFFQDVTVDEEAALRSIEEEEEDIPIQVIEDRETVDLFIQAAERLLKFITRIREEFEPQVEEALRGTRLEDRLEYLKEVPCTLCDVIHTMAYMFGIQVEAVNEIVLSGMNMDWDPEYTVWMRENAIEFTGHDPFPPDVHVFIEKDNHYDYFLLSDSSDNPRTFHRGYNGPGREIAHFETEGIWFIPTYILEEYKKGNYSACV